MTALKLDTIRMVSPGVRFKIMERDNYTCVYCGKTSTEGEIHIDHIVPWSKGGRSTIDNLVVACGTCNLGKLARRSIKESDILEIVKVRNNKHGYLTAEDMRKTTPKIKKPKLFGPKRGRTINSIHYKEGRDNKLICEVITQYMTEKDKLILLNVLQDGECCYTADGRLSFKRLHINEEELIQKVDLQFQDLIDGNNVRQFASGKANYSLQFFNIAFDFETPQDRYINHGRLQLLYSMKFDTERKTVTIEINMYETVRFLEYLLSELQE